MTNLQENLKIKIIKNRVEISRLLNSKKKIYTVYGIFFFDNEKTDDNLNYAILVKKNIGNAVKRNFCKRLVREYIRLNTNVFNNIKNFLFIFNSDQKISYNALKSEFDQKLLKLKK